ncbi:MAG: hypothetical protein FWD66_10975, partial [Paludibacter sp.]|nr:hypothetical protein [Paludibacter sp.]
MGDRITRGLASGGALSRATLRRNFGVRLPSEPLRNPARRQAPDTLAASGATVRQTTIEWLTTLESFVLRESFRESRQFDSVKDN